METFKIMVVHNRTKVWGEVEARQAFYDPASQDWYDAEQGWRLWGLVEPATGVFIREEQWLRTECPHVGTTFVPSWEVEEWP